jgi:Anti-sigma-K factor rskA
LYAIDLNYIVIKEIMKSTSIVAVWVTSIALLLTLVAVTVPLAHAQMTLDITKAGGDKPYGGEKLGTVLITPKEHTVWVRANMSAPPADGKVYEGWFVDDGGSGYKLSLGEFSKNGTLTFKEQMVNPYTYTQFIVTEEPFEDADPNAAAATGGTQLQTPFGR